MILLEVFSLLMWRATLISDFHGSKSPRAYLQGISTMTEMSKSHSISYLFAYRDNDCFGISSFLPEMIWGEHLFLSISTDTGEAQHGREKNDWEYFLNF